MRVRYNAVIGTTLCESRDRPDGAGPGRRRRPAAWGFDRLAILEHAACEERPREALTTLTGGSECTSTSGFPPA